MRVACAAMAKNVYVIGGNIREAHEFITRRGLTGCVPVDDAEALRGCTRPEVIVTGTFIARATFSRSTMCSEKRERRTASRHSL